MTAPVKPETKATKAVWAVCVSLAGALTVAAADGHVTLAEALGAASTAFLAGAGTYGITNHPK